MHKFHEISIVYAKFAYFAYQGQSSEATGLYFKPVEKFRKQQHNIVKIWVTVAYMTVSLTICKLYFTKHLSIKRR